MPRMKAMTGFFSASDFDAEVEVVGAGGRAAGRVDVEDDGADVVVVLERAEELDVLGGL